MPPLPLPLPLQKIKKKLKKTLPTQESRTAASLSTLLAEGTSELDFAASMGVRSSVSSVPSSSSVPRSRTASRGSGPRSLVRRGNARPTGRRGGGSRTYVPSDVVSVARNNDADDAGNFMGADDEIMMGGDDGAFDYDDRDQQQHGSVSGTGAVDYSLPPPPSTSVDHPLDSTSDSSQQQQQSPPNVQAAGSVRRSKFGRSSTGTAGRISAPAAQALARAKQQSKTVAESMSSSSSSGRVPGSSNGSIAGLGQVVTQEMNVDNIVGAVEGQAGGGEVPGVRCPPGTGRRRRRTSRR